MSGELYFNRLQKTRFNVADLQIGGMKSALTIAKEISNAICVFNLNVECKQHFLKNVLKVDYLCYTFFIAL